MPMQETKENQRIRLTRQLLSDALIAILGEMPIHAVSIRELCERAGINRSTFYNHYGSQYDLLEDIAGRFLNDITIRLSYTDDDSQESVQRRVTMVFQYLADNLTLSRLLLNNNSDPEFAERLFSLPKVVDLLDAALNECSEPEKRNAIITFAIHGSYRLLLEWINKDDRISPEEESMLILELARKVCR